MQDVTDAHAGRTPEERALALAAAVRRARGEMRQVHFAELMGTSQSVISTWESGKTSPSMDTLVAIEERLDLPIGTLAAEAGYFSADAAVGAGFGGMPERRFETKRLDKALRLVAAADELGHDVRLRRQRTKNPKKLRWVIELMPTPPMGEVSTPTTDMKG